MLAVTLEHVVKIWDNEEATLESKLEAMQLHTFQFLGFDHEPNYYIDNGKFFRRYLAGFLSRYFTIIKDFAFLILDPIHIINMLVAFAKNIIRHPIRTLRKIWKVWTSTYTHGAYGIGALTADALLAAMIAGATAAIAEEGAAVAAETAGETMVQKVASGATSLPRRLMKIGKGVEKAVTSHEEFFESIMSKPQAVLADAKKTIESGISFGNMETYRSYTKGLLDKHKAATQAA